MKKIYKWSRFNADNNTNPILFPFPLCTNFIFISLPNKRYGKKYKTFETKNVFVSFDLFTNRIRIAKHEILFSELKAIKSQPKRFSDEHARIRFD